MSSVATLYDIAATGDPLAGIAAAQARVKAAGDRITNATVPDPLPKLEIPDLESLAEEFRVDGWGLYISRYREFSVSLRTPRTTGSVERDFVRDLTPDQILAVTVRLEELAARIEALADEQERLAASAVTRALTGYDPALRELAKRAAAAGAAESERKAWIDANGSAHLRRLVAENIEHDGLYRAERMSRDRPGWRFWTDIPGDEHAPRNPPPDAIGLLDEARKLEPKARLVYVTVDHDHDDDCDDCTDCPKYDWSGYAALATFVGRPIIYGGPA